MERNGEMEQQEMGVIEVPQHQQYEEVEQAGGSSQLAPRPPPIKCARCDSPNTKFCYFNNYNENQPRFYCKTCRRYWTQGGSLRDIPIGGTSRGDKKSSKQALPIVNPLSDLFPAAAIDPPIGPFPAAAINPPSNPFPAEAINPLINYVPAAACNPPNNPFPAAAINPLSNLFPTSAINHMSIPLSAAVVAPLSYSFPAAAINPPSNPFPAAATIVSGPTSTPSLKIIEPGTISTPSLALTPHAHSTHIPGFESPPIVAEVQTLNQLTVLKGSALTLSSGINPPSYGLQHQQYQHITYSQAIYMDEVDNSLSQWFLCSEQGRVPPNMHSATTSGLQPIFNNSNNIIGSEAILWSTNNSNDAIGSPKSPYYWSEAPGSDPPSA